MVVICGHGWGFEPDGRGAVARVVQLWMWSGGDAEYR
jgi:hypothetical protein